VGSAHPYTPEKLVVGVLLADTALLSEVRAAIEAELGPVDFLSPLLPFPYTSYYEAEMGGGLRRCFLSASELVDPARLASIKVLTNGLEARFTVDGRRRVNLDPGTLSLSRLVLASTKDSSHRVPVGLGIYAEVTLVYEHGGFRPVEWTYPDYASDAYRAILREIRERYLAELRSLPHQRRP
jgi:hypothetical protein